LDTGLGAVVLVCRFDVHLRSVHVTNCCIDWYASTTLLPIGENLDALIRELLETWFLAQPWWPLRGSDDRWINWHEV
jgi:hypothetical protein